MVRIRGGHVETGKILKGLAGATNHVLPVLVILALASAAFAQNATTPAFGHVVGGVWVETGNFLRAEGVPLVYFGANPSLDVRRYATACTDDARPYCEDNYLVLVPPSEFAGPVDVVLFFPSSGVAYYQDGFTYYDKPVITSVSPAQHSYLPDDRPVTLGVRGIDVTGPVEVYFGDEAATNIEVRSDGGEITCSPPPFPGGTIPHRVDVRVVNQDGGEGVVENGFEYGRVPPSIFSVNRFARAWTLGEQAFAIVGGLIPGEIRVYIDGISALVVQTRFGVESRIDFVVPAHAPGLVDVSIVNSDGGASEALDYYGYYGTPSTDFHPGDLNQDFRFSMSEVLRAVQFFNSGGMHCDATSEDGYAPGVGDDTSCTPYPSDNAPFNWNLGLTELLEIIQFYNMYCYQPCPGAPGTYCPPD